jgi:hypothetical protein
VKFDWKALWLSAIIQSAASRKPALVRIIGFAIEVGQFGQCRSKAYRVGLITRLRSLGYFRFIHSWLCSMIPVLAELQRKRNDAHRPSKKRVHLNKPWINARQSKVSGGFAIQAFHSIYCLM